MKITVEKIIGKEYADRACSFTVNKDIEVNLDKLYKSEHSPCRTQYFWIEMHDIPTFASVHFCRHKYGVEHFVKSNREDRPGYTGDQGRMHPVNHAMLINAQALINMSKKRLCNKTHEITRNIMKEIKKQVAKKDPYLAKYMVPDCLYRRECGEFKSCGKPVEV